MFGGGVGCCYLSTIYICIYTVYIYICLSKNRKWLTVDFVHAISMHSHFKTIKEKRSMAEMIIQFIKDAHDATLYSMLED